MAHHLDRIGTPKKRKPKTHKLVFENNRYKVISNNDVIFESREFDRANSAKLNVVALKRYFEKLTYTEIDLAFNAKA